MKQKIFEYAVIAHPTSAEAEEGKTTELLIKPEVTLANDERAATIIASRKIPEAWLDKLDRVEIAIRPF
jgi:hypothetical protein